MTLTTHAHSITDELAADLVGNVHFIRVSLDGVSETYETIRRRPFAVFRRQLDTVRAITSFGLNYVVNAQTLPDLDAATKLAAEVGAMEFLLLPEQPVRGVGGISVESRFQLQQWVDQYRGTVPLTVSEAGAEGLPTCNPLEHEIGLRAYAHIDAASVLKRTSFDDTGIPIGADGVMCAIDRFAEFEERPNEDLGGPLLGALHEPGHDRAI